MSRRSEARWLPRPDYRRALIFFPPKQICDHIYRGRGIASGHQRDGTEQVLPIKNEFLGFSIPYVAADGQEHRYFTDFLARCRTPEGRRVNLMIEITGMNRDKAVKKWYVEHRWLPAVNAVREQYGYDEWAFIEVANDIRDIKNQVLNKISSLDTAPVPAPWRQLEYVDEIDLSSTRFRHMSMPST